MPYYLTKDELAHAAGWTKPNHKYIDRIWKNGKWNYIYNKVTSGVSNIRSRFGNTKQSQNNNAYRYSNTYLSGSSGSTGWKKTTEYTRDGQQLLSKKVVRTDKAGNKTVFKTKGKIAQGLEKAISAGSNYINNRSKKKKKSTGTHSYKEGKMDKSISYK